jgi:hypothetical protein
VIFDFQIVQFCGIDSEIARPTPCCPAGLPLPFFWIGAPKTDGKYKYLDEYGTSTSERLHDKKPQLHLASESQHQHFTLDLNFSFHLNKGEVRRGSSVCIVVTHALEAGKELI